MSTAREMHYAGFWRRFIAMLIDSLLLGAVISIIFGPGYINSSLWSYESIVKNGLSLVLTVFLWVKFIGTPGKLLLSCQVVDADTFLPISPKQAIVRYLGYYVSVLTLFVGFLWIAWDKKKQGFHDKLANTVVVYDANIERDDESQKTLQQLVSEIR